MSECVVIIFFFLGFRRVKSLQLQRSGDEPSRANRTRLNKKIISKKGGWEGHDGSSAYVNNENFFFFFLSGGRSDRRRVGRGAQGQIAHGVPDGRQMLHDVRERRVLGTGAARGGGVQGA